MTQYSAEIQELLTRIDSLQAQIQAIQPINAQQINKIFQKYRLDWNYNSNSIEGNSLNYGETVAFIMEGLTAKGKPLKDHLDIKGHNEAINFLVDMQEKESALTERDIRGLHQMILVEPYKSEAQTIDGQKTNKIINLGVYKSSPNHVVTSTGQTHYYATPEETPAMMQELMDWYQNNKSLMHPLILSSVFHHRFVSIHPFDDGNGRMSRLLSNLILMQADLPPVVVRKDQRSEYYGVLSQADAGILDPLIEYFASLLIHSLEIYLKGARGEDISDPNDLDKELALFISSFDDELLSREQISSRVMGEIFDDSILPLFIKIINYVKILNPLFHNNYFFFRKENYNDSGTDYQALTSSSTGRWLEPKSGLLKEEFLRDYFDSSQEIRRLKFSYVLSGFKAAATIKPCKITVGITFNNHDYIVQIVEDNEKITKYYPRQLTGEETDEIVKRAVRSLMSEIRQKNNSIQA